MNQKLKKLLIKTRRLIFSEIVGNNSSLLKGEGYDFMELKEYEYGDEVKNIDWIISAKMQKPYVKVFHAQKELNISIIPILGGSLYFGTKKRFKHDVVTEIASIIAYSAVKQGDPFESFIANNKIENITKKSKNIYSVTKMAEIIDNYKILEQDYDYNKLCDNIFKTIKKRSIVFLIGDFINCEGLDLRLLSKKHELITIIVRDRFEENPKELGNTNLLDPQSSKVFEGNLNDSLVKKYITKIKSNDHKLFEHFQKCGIKSTKIYTDEDVYSKLIGVLNR